MTRVILSPRARRDIADVLAFTKRRWGRAKTREYAKLIEDALAAITSDPGCGRPRDDVRPGLLAHHIARRGRPGRHVLFYRIDATGTVQVIRFLHDAMDFAGNLP